MGIARRLRDETGVIFAVAYRVLNRMAKSGELPRRPARHEQLALLKNLRERINVRMVSPA